MYFCVGGISNIIITQLFEEAKAADENPIYGNGNERYRNILEMQASEEYDKMVVFFPLQETAGSTLIYLITLISFGILGSIVKILLTNVFENVKISDANVYTFPILGGLSGLLVIVVSELLPEFKYKSGNDKLFFGMALIGGLYTKVIFEWLNMKVQNFISNNLEKKEAEAEVKPDAAAND